MSDSSEKVICGVCGDLVPYTDKHKCWALQRVQTQETIREICEVCGEPVKLKHWRCYPSGPDVQS